jgi:hypothetical protein
MLPIRGFPGFPFRPEQGLGGNRFHPRPVGQAAVTGIISLKGRRFPVDGGRGVGKYEGIVPGGPDEAISLKTAQGGAKTAEDILLGPAENFKAGPFRQGAEGAKAVFGAGKDMEIAGNGLEGLHDPED